MFFLDRNIITKLVVTLTVCWSITDPNGTAQWWTYRIARAVGAIAHASAPGLAKPGLLLNIFLRRYVLTQ